MIAAARELARELPQYRVAHDRDRQLAPAVIGALRERGLLGCLVPHLLGGAELPPREYVQVLELLARGDAATAWVTMTATTTAMLGAYLPRATADRLWSSGTPLFAGIFAPTGTLVDGKLAGTWSYASGSRHADYIALGALVADGNSKRHVMCFVPAASLRRVDNWDTLGLAGTGSHDLVADGVRVADDHVCSVFAGAPWPSTPLYRVPLFGVLASGVTACTLGVATSALEHVATKLADAPSAQLAAYATLFARLAAARAYLLATCDAAITAPHKAELRLAASHVAHECAEVVRGAFHLGGGASMRASSPLNAALRDIETMLTHKMVGDRVLPTIGRVLLGGDPSPDL